MDTKRRIQTLLVAVLMLLTVIMPLASCAKPHDLESISAVNVPERALLAEEVDGSGILLHLHYTDGQDEDVPFTVAMLSEAQRAELLKSGAHELTVSYEGKETSFTLNTLAVYTVSFRNALDAEIKTEKVVDGSAAAAPAEGDMAVAGYRFLGTYDAPFDKISADTVVRGEYVKTWNVTFYGPENEVLSAAVVDDGAAAAAPENYQKEGYLFTYWDKHFDTVTADTDVHGRYVKMDGGREIKNIIFLIPDGAGFGTYDLANALKKAYGTGVKGQATPVTTDLIEGRTVEGLYLDEFLVATANTALATKGSHSATDSAAAGTALLCGEKTNYLMVGVKPDITATANILEAARLDGKGTGFVTTKCLVDATPSTALAHSLKRADQDKCAYQLSVSKQILLSGADVILCYGSDGGYYAKGTVQGAPLHDRRAADYGYTVVTDLASMNEAVYTNKASRIFSCFQIDYQALHLLYDADAKAGTDLTLMDMAKAALTALSENSGNENGFCLIIEGGAIDNAAESRYVREAVAEYLAFDEVFGYCVNWAMHRDDTIVVAIPDHDSGGFYLPTKENGGYTLDEVLQGLHDGTIPANTQLAGAIEDGHSPQDVPVWLYAPGYAYIEILDALGLPHDTRAETVRSGLFNDGSSFNGDCSIKNSDMVHALLSVAGWTSLEEATAKLLVNANEFGTYDQDAGVFTFRNGETIEDCSNVWKDKNGTVHEFSVGYAFYLTNPATYAYEGNDLDGTARRAFTPYKAGRIFYVPRDVLAAMGYVTD